MSKYCPQTNHTSSQPRANEQANAAALPSQTQTFRGTLTKPLSVDLRCIERSQEPECLRKALPDSQR